MEPDVSDPSSATDSSGDEDMDNPVETRKRPSIKKKMPGFKKIMRRRQNARLQKLLQPKDAVSVLYDLKPHIYFICTGQRNGFTQTSYNYMVEVDGIIHDGYGLSRESAQQSAAENALKALFLEKMTLAAAKQQKSKDGTVSTDTPETTSTDDEVAWVSLASFALFKLFADWQRRETHVPIAKQTPTPPPVVPAKTAPMKQLPNNPTERDPILLLVHMRPGVAFKETSKADPAYNVTYTMTVIVDGVTYVGIGKGKKIARNAAAKAALAGTFGIVYPS